MFVFPQYCNGGDLADYLQGERRCNSKHTLRLFMIKLLVLQQCHVTEWVLECANMIVCVCCKLHKYVLRVHL